MEYFLMHVQVFFFFHPTKFHRHHIRQHKYLYFPAGHLKRSSRLFTQEAFMTHMLYPTVMTHNNNQQFQHSHHSTWFNSADPHNQHHIHSHPFLHSNHTSIEMSFLTFDSKEWWSFQLRLLCTWIPLHNFILITCNDYWIVASLLMPSYFFCLLDGHLPHM